MPWVVVSIETFGDLVNFHLHPHCLVTDGCFMANDWFYVLPEIDIKKLESFFRHIFSGENHLPSADENGFLSL